MSSVIHSMPGFAFAVSSSIDCTPPSNHLVVFPSAWNASARPRPMPLPPPVIRIVFPVIFIRIFPYSHSMAITHFYIIL